MKFRCKQSMYFFQIVALLYHRCPFLKWKKHGIFYMIKYYLGTLNTVYRLDIYKAK